MTATYRIVAAAHLKHVVISGTTDFAELRQLFLDYLDDPEFRPDLRIMADLLDMKNPVAGLWEIRKLKQLYQHAYHDAVAVVDVVIVARRGIAYRAARAFQLFMRDRKPMVIRITDCLGKAQQMLDIDAAVMQALYAHARPGGIKLLP